MSPSSSSTNGNLIVYAFFLSNGQCMLVLIERQVLTENIVKTFYPYRPICMLLSASSSDDGCLRKCRKESIFNGNSKYYHIFLLWALPSNNEVPLFEVLHPNMLPYTSF